MKITKFLDLLLFLNSPYSNLKIMMMMVTIVMMILMTTVDCEARGQTVYTWRSPGALSPSTCHQPLLFAWGALSTSLHLSYIKTRKDLR